MAFNPWPPVIVGTWLTCPPSIMVAIVSSTLLVANSHFICSSQTAVSFCCEGDRVEPGVGTATSFLCSFLFISVCPQYDSRLRVNLRAFFHKLLRLFFHPFLQRLFFGDALFGGVFADVFGDLHRTEVRAAHGAEVCGLGTVLRIRRSIHFPQVADLRYRHCNRAP